jgi:hypothetical protein
MVGDARPTSALEAETPAIVLLKVLMLSVSICPCSVIVCVPVPALGRMKLNLRQRSFPNQSDLFGRDGTGERVAAQADLFALSVEVTTTAGMPQHSIRRLA